jgi:hypothetical protein
MGKYGSMGVWECGSVGARPTAIRQRKQFESLTLVNIHWYEIHFILFSADFI